jgi:hypothetical protein
VPNGHVFVDAHQELLDKADEVGIALDLLQGQGEQSIKYQAKVMHLECVHQALHSIALLRERARLILIV